jgi:hypothetical protein
MRKIYFFRVNSNVTPNDKGERQSCLDPAAANISIHAIHGHSFHFDQDLFSSDRWHRKISILNGLWGTHLFNVGCFHRVFSL